MIKTQYPSHIARDRRAILAHAVTEWMNQPWNDESDLALEAILIETNVTTSSDVVVEFETTDDMNLIVALDDGTAIEIDQQGNYMKGQI
jgi:hypothetical protein